MKPAGEDPKLALTQDDFAQVMAKGQTTVINTCLSSYWIPSFQQADPWLGLPQRQACLGKLLLTLVP